VAPNKENQPMNILRDALRRALRRLFRFPTTLSLVSRLTLAFGIVATILTSTVGQPAPVRAAELPGPARRLQVVVRNIEVIDDREGALSGFGEIDFSASIWICNELEFPECQIDNGHVKHGTLMASIDRRINAYSGDVVSVESAVPGDGYVMPGSQVSQRLGFPLFEGHKYVVMFHAVEFDGGWSGNEDMGAWYQRLDINDLLSLGGTGIGTHTERSLRADGIHSGDFRITYEVRVAPTPDLGINNIRVLDLPGSAKKLFCMQVLNVGGETAGPFQAALYDEQTLVPGGVAQAGRLAAQEGGELCVEAALGPGRHHLKAVADLNNTVDELDESNNSYEQVYDLPLAPGAPPAVPAASPVPASKESVTLPAPGAALADLGVGAIKVNGQVPDGKDDCKDGKNVVTVVVKNEGAADAEKLTVRLVVDGVEDPALEKSANGIKAGQEQEVRFEDVRLRKGERKLTASVDARGAVSESNETHKGRTVTADCQGAS
jgi:hypothetical protein